MSDQKSPENEIKTTVIPSNNWYKLPISKVIVFLSKKGVEHNYILFERNKTKDKIKIVKVIEKSIGKSRVGINKNKLRDYYKPILSVSASEYIQSNCWAFPGKTEQEQTDNMNYYIAVYEVFASAAFAYDDVHILPTPTPRKVFKSNQLHQTVPSTPMSILSTNRPNTRSHKKQTNKTMSGLDLGMDARSINGSIYRSGNTLIIKISEIEHCDFETKSILVIDHSGNTASYPSIQSQFELLHKKIDKNHDIAINLISENHKQTKKELTKTIKDSTETFDEWTKKFKKKEYNKKKNLPKRNCSNYKEFNELSDRQKLRRTQSVLAEAKKNVSMKISSKNSLNIRWIEKILTFYPEMAEEIANIKQIEMEST